jgi:hypothetical protein
LAASCARAALLEKTMAAATQAKTADFTGTLFSLTSVWARFGC